MRYNIVQNQPPTDVLEAQRWATWFAGERAGARCRGEPDDVLSGAYTPGARRGFRRGAGGNLVGLWQGGHASRALATRFSMTCSIWPGSITTDKQHALAQKGGLAHLRPGARIYWWQATATSDTESTKKDVWPSIPVPLNSKVRSWPAHSLASTVTWNLAQAKAASWLYRVTMSRSV